MTGFLEREAESTTAPPPAPWGRVVAVVDSFIISKKGNTPKPAETLESESQFLIQLSHF